MCIQSGIKQYFICAPCYSVRSATLRNSSSKNLRRTPKRAVYVIHVAGELPIFTYFIHTKRYLGQGKWFCIAPAIFQIQKF